LFARSKLIDSPLVSVVIPAFNASNTLQQTLLSVSAQTYRNMEIIVVDDGSADHTALIARDFSQIDPRVRLIQKSNGGVASARNAGTQASAADFMAFIDADDLWHPTKIAKQIALLTAGGNDMALVYSPFRLIDTAGMVVGSSRNHRVEGWVVNRHFYINFIGNGSSILIRKHVLEELGG
jgi:glycosyltransferase involved in cell wall biosynthesis